MRGFLKIILKRASASLGALTLIGLSAWTLLNADAAAKSSGQESNTQALTVQAGFSDKQSIAPDEPIELIINRPLAQNEGRLAIVVGATDLTDLFAVSAQNLKYGVGKSFPLSLGETELTVYLVAPNGDWREVARFPLRVGETTAPVAASTESKTGENDAKVESQSVTDASAKEEPSPEQPSQPAPQTEAPVKRRFGFDKLDFAPQLNIGFKSQCAETRFPDTNRPDRTTFADAILQ